MFWNIGLKIILRKHNKLTERWIERRYINIIIKLFEKELEPMEEKLFSKMFFFQRCFMNGYLKNGTK